MLIALVVALGGVCIYLNWDWFSSEDIQIYHRTGPQRGGFFRRGRQNTPPPVASAANPVFFGFNRKVQFKSVKVVPVSDLETNKHPRAIWYLLSDSNSIATKGFPYGMNLQGMRPAIKGALPDPLEPGVKYRLFVQGPGLKAEHDFVASPKTP